MLTSVIYSFSWSTGGSDADVVTYVVTSGHDSVPNVLLDVVSTPSRWRINVSFIKLMLFFVELSLYSVSND